MGIYWPLFTALIINGVFLNLRALEAVAEPATLGSLHPLAVVRRVAMPTSVKDRAKSELFSLESIWSNTFDRKKSLYTADCEDFEMRPTMRVALTETVSIIGALPIVTRGGGTLDHPIEEFHDIFSFSQGGRTTSPQDRCQLSGITESGDTWDLNRRGTALPELLTSLTYDLDAPPEPFTLSYTEFFTGIRIPTGDDLLGYNAAAISTGISIARPLLTELAITLSGELTYNPRSTLGELELQPFIGDAALGLNFSALEHLELFVRLGYTTHAVDNIVGFPADDRFVDFGLTGEIYRTKLSASMRQNLQSYGTVDLGLLLSVVVNLS